MHLISTQLFLEMFIIQNRLSIPCYQEYKLDEVEQEIVDISSDMNINIKPYLFVLSTCDDIKLNHFTKYLLTYLEIDDIIDIYSLLKIDLETTLCCIYAMQYYFI
jgi:hypothetical protein